MKFDLTDPRTPLTPGLSAYSYTATTGEPMVRLFDDAAGLSFRMFRETAIRLRELLGGATSCSLGEDGLFFYSPDGLEVGGVVYKIPDVARLRDKLSQALATSLDDERFTLTTRQVLEVTFEMDLPVSEVQVTSLGTCVQFALGDAEVCVEDDDLPLLIEGLQAYLAAKQAKP